MYTLVKSGLPAILLTISVVLNFSNGQVINEKEKQLLSQLRPLVDNLLYEDYMKEDDYLVPFLRVRDFDIQRSKDMIEEVMTWRKKNNIDTILLEDFGPIEKEFPVVFDDSVDKDGRPILIMKIPNLRNIMLGGQKENFMRLYYAIMEAADVGFREMNQQSKYKNFTHAFGIIDIGGFNLRQHACIQCIQLIPPVMTAYENYYPDSFYRLYGVNTPAVFLPTFEIIRPLLSTATKNSLKLFDQNSDKWKKTLLEEIPADQLPVLYGGTRKNVVPTTFTQLRQKNPYVKAAYEKLLAKNNKTT